MRLATLYHWSPTTRRESILEKGLLIKSVPSIATHKMKVICLGTCPRRAWALSGGINVDITSLLVKEYDLWQVFPKDDWEVEFLPQWGCCIGEVRVRHNIPPDRLWLIGCRDVGLFEKLHNDAIVKRTLGDKTKSCEDCGSSQHTTEEH